MLVLIARVAASWTDRPSLCVGVLPAAWDGDDEIGDRSGLELVSGDFVMILRSFAKYIRGSRLPTAWRKTFAFVQDMFKPSAARGSR